MTCVYHFQCSHCVHFIIYSFIFSHWLMTCMYHIHSFFLCVHFIIWSFVFSNWSWMGVLYFQVFHCVHFESPADTSVGSLINSVATVSVTSGPPNSPRTGQTQQGPAYPLPSVDRGPSLSRSSSSSTSSRSESQQSVATTTRVHFPQYYGPPPPPSSQQQQQPLLPQPSPPQGLAEPSLHLGHYAGHMLQQQDVPEADRMDIHWSPVHRPSLLRFSKYDTTALPFERIQQTGIFQITSAMLIRLMHPGD